MDHIRLKDLSFWIYRWCSSVLPESREVDADIIAHHHINLKFDKVESAWVIMDG